jgi:hypothetical protein
VFSVFLYFLLDQLRCLHETVSSLQVLDTIPLLESSPLPLQSFSSSSINTGSSLRTQPVDPLKARFDTPASVLTKTALSGNSASSAPEAVGSRAGLSDWHS